jgi:hypothetical protein
MAAKIKNSAKYEEAKVLYEKLVVTDPKIERKGDTLPYTSHNGHMFSILYKDGSMGLRLPEKDLDVFSKNTKQKIRNSMARFLKNMHLFPALYLGRPKS